VFKMPCPLECLEPFRTKLRTVVTNDIWNSISNHDDDDDDDKLYLNTEKTHQYKEAIVIYKLLDSIKIQ
jgi:RNA binding exosome subunit